MSSRSRESNRLRIVIYSEGLPVTGDDPVDCSLGGAETAVVSMARALAKRGHEVTVYAKTSAPRMVADVQYVPSAQLSNEYDATGCDIFLSCRAHEVVERLRGACAIGLWHHDPPDSGTIGLTRRGLRKAAFALFLSQFHFDGFAKHIPGLAPFARITSNGVDHDAIEEVLRHRRPASGPPKFIYGARPLRGLEFLLTKIWPRIVHVLPGAELLLAGYDIRARCEEDPTRIAPSREWNRYFDHLAGQQPGVRSLGSLSRRRFWEAMADCTALLYPTDTPEVNCMIALEAQALGVPMVTTDDFALRETLGFKPTRVKAPWGTSEYVAEFVETTLRLVEDRAFASEARTAGFAHVSPATHSWDAIAVQWETLFQAELENPVVVKKAPKLSVLILVRRGEEMLLKSLPSICGIADEVIIGDARPTEVLQGKALETGICAPICKTVTIKFIDCAQARNDMAGYAVGEYILSMDAGEVLAQPDLLREAVEMNVFFDAFKIDCAVPNAIQWPAEVRCFRRETPEGLLRWFGCCYESVGYEANVPPLRCREVAGVAMRLEDPVAPLFRGCVDENESEWLMAEDRRKNPGRMRGYLMRMLHALANARRELSRHGGMTRAAQDSLNDCIEIWRCQETTWREGERETAFQWSREALALLAQFAGRLRATRRRPLEATYSFELKRGKRSQPVGASERLHFVDVAELQRFLNERIARTAPELNEQLQDAPLPI